MMQGALKQCGALGLAVLFLLFAQGAQAFFDPPWITPAVPRAGETVSVNIHGGVCDGIFSRPGYPQITQQGNTVRLLEYGHHWDDVDLCIYGIGTLVEPIGSFPPGDYVLNVDLMYPDFFGEPQILNIGVVPFSVTGATPPISVPTFSLAGLLTLVLVMGGFAARTLQHRYRWRRPHGRSW